MTPADPDQLRADSREAWERTAAGWGKQADRIRDWGLPVSVTMVDALALQPGDRVLELAAGPGDTGFMAAELVAPGGTLICSDGAEAMLAIARERAAAAGLRNVEFRQLELEWIDLDAASVDAVLCRWGIMLLVDPAAAALEIRRILRPGRRAAFAVWDEADRNPWATIVGRTMVALGHAEPPDPDEPGMFALAAPGALQELLHGAGFADVAVRPVTLERRFARPGDYVAEMSEVSMSFAAALSGLDDRARAEVTERISAQLEEYLDDEDQVVLPGSSLVAVATA
ncbi:MAG TPA: methyltransferase domain-containing protein [Solirubrobacteraceae bacterium]|nr:methyltransferase domain-containing protein [Solirubrobacteraceae bacterium]